MCTGGGIGDVLLATPCMRALRSKYAQVAALTAPAQAPVLSGNPDLDQVLLADVGFGELRARIARERFDAAIVTWATPQTALLPFVAGIPVRVGQARRPYSFLFTKRVTVRSELGDHSTHWTQVLLDYARALDCEGTQTVPTFVVPPGAQARVDALLSAGNVARPYLVLHPTRGIAASRARWPVESLAALGRALQNAFNMPLVVTGSALDRDVTGAVASAAGALSLAGRTTIGEFGALAAGAHVVVAMDSGPMHVAAAVGAPTVGIFALQSDEPQRWAPLGARVAVVRGTYPCPPWHRKETCPDFACIRELPVMTVVQAARDLLDSGDRAARLES